MMFERGNAAALREALVKIHGIAKTFMDATRMRHVTDSARIDVGDIEYLANAALSAPARNCDIYKTSWDVITHWDGGLDSAQNIVRMLDWLLAPAAERKGEGDEQK